MSLGILIKGLSNCKKKWHTSVYHWGYNIQEYTPTILQSSQSHQLPWRENTTRPCTPQIQPLHIFTGGGSRKSSSSIFDFSTTKAHHISKFTDHIWLVVYLPLWKNMSSSVGMTIPNIWKNKTCSKPPIRYCYNHSRSQISRSSFGWTAQEKATCQVILYIKLRGTTWALRLDIATYGYGSIPINTIFKGDEHP